MSLMKTFLQGGTIKPLVKLLRVKMEQKQKLLLGEEINSHVTDHLMAGIEEIAGQRGEHYFRVCSQSHQEQLFLLVTSNETLVLKYKWCGS